MQTTQTLILYPKLKTGKTFFVGRLISENIFIFLLQFIGTSLTVLQPTPMWMSTGTAIGFLFLRGLTITPGIWLGTFAAYELANQGITYSALAATLFTLQAASLLLISYRLRAPSLVFYSPNLFFKFLFCSAVITGLITLNLDSWLANFAGLTIAFAITTLDAYFPEITELQKLNKVILGFSFGSFTVLTILYGVHPGILVLIPLLGLAAWIAYSYQWCGAVMACTIFGIALNFFKILN